jgi:hypothetical protein|tara:strand:- start:1914 stop:2306 length:393 start_codon:yes stop_codon:yes gene_type:complete
MSKCEGTTAKGNACKNEAVPGSTFCGNHRPNSEIFAGLMEEEKPNTEEKDQLLEADLDIEEWEKDTSREKVFFDAVYEHFCDKMLDELSFESFYDIAKELKLINEEPYDSDKHGDNYDAQEGESVIVKCK